MIAWLKRDCRVDGHVGVAWEGVVMAADSNLFEELLSFAMTRAKERKERGNQARDWKTKQSAESEIKLMVMLAADVRAHPWAMVEGIEWLRARAAKDSEHPDFDPIWALTRE